MALTIPSVLLLLLAVWGFWTLWGFPYNNGLLKILSSETEPGAFIPGPTAAPMKQSYTGIGAVDKELTILVSFFYTAIDGNRADVSLSFLDLGGQVLAAWVLITIEGLRSGNSGKWILGLTTLFGISVAIVGFACVAPLWFAIHLWSSPTVVNPKDYQLIVGQPIELAIAPISIILGFGLPSLVMCLPAPDLISFESKQTWAGIQQGWAIWIGLVQLALTAIVMSVNQKATILTDADKKVKTIKYLRRAYAFALASSAGAHLASWSLPLLAYAFPVLFSPTYLPQLQPSRIFVPVVPFGSEQVKTLADGALGFLQWDLITGTVATLLWGLTLRIYAKNEVATPIQWIIGLVKVAVIATLVGPAGAAVIAIWGRDELVFAHSDTTAESKDKSA